MPFRPKYEYFLDPEVGIQLRVDEESAEQFNENLLNLGDIRKNSPSLDALAVLFDLEGFTAFTKQVDPQLTVPNYLGDFLQWLFANVKSQLVSDLKKRILWAAFPFFSKFTGDGVLFLWKIDSDKIQALHPNRPSDEVQAEIRGSFAISWPPCWMYVEHTATSGI